MTTMVALRNPNVKYSLCFCVVDDVFKTINKQIKYRSMVHVLVRVILALAWRIQIGTKRKKQKKPYSKLVIIEIEIEKQRQQSVYDRCMRADCDGWNDVSTLACQRWHLLSSVCRSLVTTIFGVFNIIDFFFKKKSDVAETCDGSALNCPSKTTKN